MNLIRSTVLFLIVVTEFFVSSLSQVEARPARERNLESVRAYGRGKTFVAATESDESSRMNPATLGEDHKVNFQFRPAQVDLFIGDNTRDTIGELSDISADKTAPLDLLQNFSDKFGKQQYLRSQLATGFRILNFDFTPFVSTSNWLDLRVPVMPEPWVHSNTLIGANFSFGLPITKSFYVGTTVRPFYRYYFDTELSFADVMGSLGEEEFKDIFVLKSGSGIAVDLGLIYLIGKQTRLGLTIEDTGYTTADNSDKSKQPPAEAHYVSAGMMTFFDYKPWRLDFSFDMHDLTNPEGIHMLRMVHTGLEFGRSYISRDQDIGLTAGLNEGYFTLGTYADLYIARLDIVSYGVELGEYPGQRQDRRLGVSLRTSMTF